VKHFVKLTTTDGNVWVRADMIVGVQQDPAFPGTCMVTLNHRNPNTNLSSSLECSETPEIIIKQKVGVGIA
jgi:hypothetical protein